MAEQWTGSGRDWGPRGRRSYNREAYYLSLLPCYDINSHPFLQAEGKRAIHAKSFCGNQGKLMHSRGKKAKWTLAGEPPSPARILGLFRSISQPYLALESERFLLTSGLR